MLNLYFNVIEIRNRFPNELLFDSQKLRKRNDLAGNWATLP